MIARLLYLIFLIFVVRQLWRSVIERLSFEARARMDGNAGGAGGPSRSATVYKGVMVRDPQCGVYLPENRSITEVQRGERIHFCSQACRSAYHEARTEGLRASR
jgi:YHS domain-containing protein